MTEENQKNENIGVKTTQDSDLEDMLQEAENKMKEKAEADFTGLLKKIKELENQLQEKEEIAKNSQINYLHLKSDFDILQRQTEQKINNANRDATLKVVKDFLPFLENLRKSILNLNEEQRASTMGKGVIMVYENFLNSLKKLNIQAIEAVGVEPDPQFHEAIGVQPTEDENLKGKIIEEFSQGFYYENENGDEKIIITPSKVIVGQ